MKRDLDKVKYALQTKIKQMVIKKSTFSGLHILNEYVDMIMN